MAQFGDFFLYGATASLLATFVLYILAWRGRTHLLPVARRLYTIGTGCIVAALATLVYLIMTHDFSVAYVFSYSDRSLPWYFLFSSLWGGQEGTFLLWLFYVGMMGAIMIGFAKKFERGNMVFVTLFMLSILFILLKKSPFTLLPQTPPDGAGLNPLLQNFWMTIHPPIMFIGFAGALFPFVFAMTGLVERRYREWAEASRRWTMFAFIALGVALVMGGYWAYETLGWGGFWAWDPVENSSLIPWLFLGAQVHSLFIHRQRKGLMRFSMVAVCLSFWSVLYGTFLTRSGVLADFSVHSFVDLGINQFLIGGLFAFIAIGASLIIYRWRDIKPEPSFSKTASRSYLVTLGVVVLFLGAVLVLLGTSAPLLTRFTDNPSNVGLDYYFATMTPIAIAILLLVALFPNFRWNHGVSRRGLLITGASIGVATSLTMLLTGVTSSILFLLLFGAAAWAVVSNGTVFVKTWREGNLRPGYLSHVGLAFGLTGAMLATAFSASKTITLHQNEPAEVMGYTATFADLQETEKGFTCHVDFTDGDDSFEAVLAHEFPRNAEGVMRKPHVENFVLHDLYVSPMSFEPGERNDPGVVLLRKGETTHIDKYDITFNDFDLSNHGESHMVATAMVTVAYNGTTEEVSPALAAHDEELMQRADTFDDGRAMIEIIGVSPDDGAVRLRVSGDFVQPATVSAASLVVEVSHKPFIGLFWFGAMIVFFGGGLSLRSYRRRRQVAEVVPMIETTPERTRARAS